MVCLLMFTYGKRKGIAWEVSICQEVSHFKIHSEGLRMLGSTNIPHIYRYFTLSATNSIGITWLLTQAYMTVS